MEIQDLVQLVPLIANVGFPVLACVFMAKFISAENDKNHAEQEKLLAVISKNTEAFTKLTIRLEVLEKRLSEEAKS